MINFKEDELWLSNVSKDFLKGFDHCILQFNHNTLIYLRKIIYHHEKVSSLLQLHLVLMVIKLILHNSFKIILHLEAQLFILSYL